MKKIGLKGLVAGTLLLAGCASPVPEKIVEVDLSGLISDLNVSNRRRVAFQGYTFDEDAFDVVNQFNAQSSNRAITYDEYLGIAKGYDDNRDKNISYNEIKRAITSFEAISKMPN